MHFTLHLTDECNLACRYCYVKQNTHQMTIETARAAVDLAEKTGGHSGIVFFGGEPLLCRDLIYETVEYAEQVEKRGYARFHYKITTNGTLLDDEFLNYSLEHKIFIALSHDGVRNAHDKNRVTKEGRGSFDILDNVIEKLLGAHPYAPVLMTVSSSTVEYYAQGVEYLYGKGFKYLICSLDYAGDWDDEKLHELKRQYKKLALFYKKHTLNEDKFYLSPFEVKISSHVRGDRYCADRCELGKKQISVSWDGKLYPCVQFAGDEAYSIGDVSTGIDRSRQSELFLQNNNEKDSCADCAIKNRCNHHCGCLNRQSTGSIERVSPVLCAHERILLPIADRLAEDLYKERNAMFIQKQYNDMFPLLSLSEDKTDNT